MSGSHLPVSASTAASAGGTLSVCVTVNSSLKIIRVLYCSNLYTSYWHFTKLIEAANVLIWQSVVSSVDTSKLLVLLKQLYCFSC